MKQYQLVAFIRVDPEEVEPVAYEEALKEKKQQELMCPENIYRIEKIKEERYGCALRAVQRAV